MSNAKSFLMLYSLMKHPQNLGLASITVIFWNGAFSRSLNMKFGIICTNEIQTFPLLCFRGGETYKMNLG